MYNLHPLQSSNKGGGANYPYEIKKALAGRFYHATNP